MSDSETTTDRSIMLLVGAVALSIVAGMGWAEWYFRPAPVVLAFGTSARVATPADDGEYVENLKAEYRTEMADPSGTRIYWNTFNATEAERERHDRLVAVAERELGIAGEEKNP